MVRGVVPTDLTCRAVDDIAAFVGADLADSATWHNGVPELDGVVPMHHAQSLWDIRQCPNLYEVFQDFFGTPQLIVDINRCIFRPPVRPGFPAESVMEVSETFTGIPTRGCRGPVHCRPSYY